MLIEQEENSPNVLLKYESMFLFFLQAVNIVINSLAQQEESSPNVLFAIMFLSSFQTALVGLEVVQETINEIVAAIRQRRVASIHKLALTLLIARFLLLSNNISNQLLEDSKDDIWNVTFQKLANLFNTDSIVPLMAYFLSTVKLVNAFLAANFIINQAIFFIFGELRVYHNILRHNLFRGLKDIILMGIINPRMLLVNIITLNSIVLTLSYNTLTDIPMFLCSVLQNRLQAAQLILMVEALYRYIPNNALENDGFRGWEQHQQHFSRQPGQQHQEAPQIQPAQDNRVPPHQDPQINVSEWELTCPILGEKPAVDNAVIIRNSAFKTIFDRSSVETWLVRSSQQSQYHIALRVGTHPVTRQPFSQTDIVDAPEPLKAAIRQQNQLSPR